MLPALVRPAATLSGAGADKIALHVSQAAQRGNHQSPVLKLSSSGSDVHLQLEQAVVGPQ